MSAAKKTCAWCGRKGRYGFRDLRNVGLSGHKGATVSVCMFERGCEQRANPRYRAK